MDHFTVGSRTVAMADVETARKYCDTVSQAIKTASHTFKIDYFLFLLAFQGMDEPEQVRALLSRYQPPGREVRMQIALMDVTYGRSLLCGPRIRNERYQELLKLLRLGR
jgi:hypothetical protein